jgi:ATP-dependent RNA helicase DeaD
MKFDELPLKDGIKRALKEIGFVEMFPIQEYAIPPMLEGRNVIGQAKTGTGKTAAFGVPMLQILDSTSGNVEGLVLAPTRELALQINDDLNIYYDLIRLRAILHYSRKEEINLRSRFEHACGV